MSFWRGQSFDKERGSDVRSSIYTQLIYDTLHKIREWSQKMWIFQKQRNKYLFMK